LFNNVSNHVRDAAVELLIQVSKKVYNAISLKNSSTVKFEHDATCIQQLGIEQEAGSNA